VPTNALIVSEAEYLQIKVDKNASVLRRQLSPRLALLFLEDPCPEASLINPFYLPMLVSIVRSCAERG
jgi:hypothetical protein